MVEITIRKRNREDAAFTQRKFFKKTARGKVVKGTPRSSLFVTRVPTVFQSFERDISGMMSPAGLKSVENAPLPPVHVYLSVVPSTTSSSPMAISSCQTQMYSLPRSVLHALKRHSSLNSFRRWTSWNRAISNLPLYFYRQCWRKSDIGLFPFTTDLRH
jgi:hypothetical protein